MKLYNVAWFAVLLLICFGCKQPPVAINKAFVYKGLYSYGPEIKSFKECESGHEFWAADSSARLELQYSQLNFEKPYEPVYVEIEGYKLKCTKADSASADYDSIMIVKKLRKITKVIPQDCN